jgi:protein-S-isoprenylcysteine O-methyltransferase Ste14
VTDAPGVVAPPPFIYLGALVLGFALEALLPSASLPAWLTWSLGGVLLLAGIALMSSFLTAFRRAHTNVDVRRPTTTIVTTGPYRFTRNPAYVGLTLIYSGIAILAGALWPFATLAVALVVMDVGVIRREERYLERKFGDEYLRFKAQRRRWL